MCVLLRTTGVAHIWIAFTEHDAAQARRMGPASVFASATRVPLTAIHTAGAELFTKGVVADTRAHLTSARAVMVTSHNGMCLGPTRVSLLHL